MAAPTLEGGVVRLDGFTLDDELGLARIELYIEPDNAASRGVARRAGYLEEGVLRDRLQIGDARRDAVLYARLPHHRPPRP